MSEKRVEIYTDGACSGNPGPGGWGAILSFDGTVKELSGGEALTTNNRMELLAAIESLNSLKRPVPVDLHSDSQYLRDGITKWIHGWKRNGWRTADKKPVKNAELWQALDAARTVHDVTFHWVKGHAGHALNERADELARLGMAPFKKGGFAPAPGHAAGGAASPAAEVAKPPATLAASLRAAPAGPRRTTSRPRPATPRRSEP